MLSIEERYLKLQELRALQQARGNRRQEKSQNEKFVKEEWLF